MNNTKDPMKGHHKLFKAFYQQKKTKKIKLLPNELKSGVKSRYVSIKELKDPYENKEKISTDNLLSFEDFLETILRIGNDLGNRAH